jgi:hypothetical protein
MQTPFQMHQWIETRKDLEKGGLPLVIGDWVIGERQMVRKGDPIGKKLTVQAPVWMTLKDSFEVPQYPSSDVKDKRKAPKGAHFDMIQGGRPAVLVDFSGGKRLNRNNGLEEETAVDALVLMPNGQLTVLNSRHATDIRSTDKNIRDYAKQRLDRVVNARKRIEDINAGLGGGRGGAEVNPGNMPKGFPGPGPLPGKGGS